MVADSPATVRHGRVERCGRHGRTGGRLGDLPGGHLVQPGGVRFRRRRRRRSRLWRPRRPERCARGAEHRPHRLWRVTVVPRRDHHHGQGRTRRKRGRWGRGRFWRKWRARWRDAPGHLRRQRLGPLFHPATFFAWLEERPILRGAGGTGGRGGNGGRGGDGAPGAGGPSIGVWCERRVLETFPVPQLGPGGDGGVGPGGVAGPEGREIAFLNCR